MKISLKWLNRHVDLKGMTAEQVRDDLTLSTAEIEGIHEFGAGMEDLVVGHVVEREKHPDADKLSVTRVDLGEGDPVQIVCGAPNVRQGLKVAVIRPGSRLPEVDGEPGMKIKKSKIRGVESFGMICSERELGLSEEHDGILELPDSVTPGLSLERVLPVRDRVLEIDNKSVNHRPDLWGHYGFARELAAIHGLPLKPLSPILEFPAQGTTVPVEVADAVGCPRYTGLCIDGVQVAASPAWLRYLLAAVGQRAIDLVVDLTNFVQLDLGQPMHAFDLRDLRGGEGAGAGLVRVRRAESGESIRTLDGQDRALEGGDLLITAQRRGEGKDVPVALAGVMGGEGTMVAPDTTELFVESATFHAATVRRTSTRLGLRTDSSARFEKSLDPEQALLAQHHFLSLLQKECPGARASGPLVDPTGWSFTPPVVGLRRARLDLKLGHHVPDGTVVSILTGLGFGVGTDADGWRVTVPSFRASKDISIEDDLIEEVGRMFRYGNIPEQPLRQVVEPPPLDAELHLARRVVRLAAAELGAHEVYNYSFQSDMLLEQVGASDLEYVRVENPVAPEQARIRRHVLPSTLACVAENLRRQTDVRLFEHGKGYDPDHRDADQLPRETRELAVVFAVRDGEHPYGELREALASLLDRVGHPVEMRDLLGAGGPSWCHPGRTVAIEHPAGSDGKSLQTVGYVGALHPEVARNMELPFTVAIASVDLRLLARLGGRQPRYAPISRFPTQPVDVALLVPKGVRVAEVEAFLRGCGKQVVQQVQLFEVYAGEGIPEGQKSLNFTVTLGSNDRTLSAKDEEKYLRRVRETADSVGAELRG